MSLTKLLSLQLTKFLVPRRVRLISCLIQQNYSIEKKQTNGEVHIQAILKNSFPTATNIQVQDISGGCGSMYEVHIESSDFVGKRTVQQHKLVTDALKDEVSKMHGLRIFTSVPT